MGVHLPGEHLLRRVVVHQRGERRRLGVEGDRAQRPTVVAITADELRREMLRLRRAASVADGEQALAGIEGAGEEAAPMPDAVEVALQPRDRAPQRSQVAAADVEHGQPVGGAIARASGAGRAATRSVPPGRHRTLLDVMPAGRAGAPAASRTSTLRSAPAAMATELLWRDNGRPMPTCGEK